MKVVDPMQMKKFSKHFLECRTHSGQMPKELAELQNYLKHLSNYVEKYDHITENTIEQEIRTLETQDDYPTCETSFSVKEDVANGRTPVEIIVIPQSEPVTIISQPDEKDSDVASNDSEIGIYFIEHVKPVRFINIIQRELSALTELFPSVACISHEMEKEFDHFKVCCGCLEKVSPLLPDILKEVQELIKFIKKTRKESYTWPDDSDYLRNSSEPLWKTFKKDEENPREKKIREETIGFVTIQTKSPNILREVESTTFGEHTSEYIRRYSVRLIKCPILSVFRSENDVTFFEKVATLEKVTHLVVTDGVDDRETSFLTEFSTAQTVRILHPVPVLKKAIQFKNTGSITYSAQNDGAREISFATLNREESENSLAIQAKEFPTTPRLALELQNRGRMETEKELKANVRDLNDLMVEAHENQDELTKVLVEKGVLNATIIRQLTDTEMFYEEKDGMEKARNYLIDGRRTLDDITVEELRRSVEDLKRRCNVKNRMIIALVNGLRSNVPEQHWEELISYVLLEVGTENLEDFLRKSSTSAPERHQSLKGFHEWKTWTRKEFEAEEIPREREIKGTCTRPGKTPGKDKARISFSEVISTTSKFFHTVESGTSPQTPLRTVRGLREMNSEAEKLLGHLENEIHSIIKYQNRYKTEDRHRQDRMTTEQRKAAPAPATMTNREMVKNEPGSATINLTIKIADEETVSHYQSAVSVVPSGATLTEKKSEISLPSLLQRAPDICFFKENTATTGRRSTSAASSFTSLALKFKVPVTFRENAGVGKTKTKAGNVTPEGIIITPAEPSLESETSVTSDPTEYEKIPENDPHVRKYSVESLTRETVTECQSDTSTLYPQINIYCDQNTKMQKLRSRLKILEESLRSLTRTIDRMDVLTEKLSDDAYESSQNFKDISNRYSIISNCLG